MNVWKYPLEVVGEQKIRTPATWKPLSVDYQGGVLTLWAEIELTREPEVMRTIVIVGTGHKFDARGLTYIGTVVDGSRGLVWHVYLSEEN